MAVAAIVASRIGRPPGADAPAELPPGQYEVERVIDGDTLVLVNGAKLRLIGVDAPELHLHGGGPAEAYSHEATDFTSRFVGGGTVRLEFDRETHDKYGRFLVFVYVDDRCLNEELLRAGLAEAELRYRYRQAMKTRFVRAEKQARDRRLGIWSEAEVAREEKGASGK